MITRVEIVEIATPSARSVFEAFSGFSRRRAPAERCDLCGAGVAAEHPHLLRVADDQIQCACDPCATLFAHREFGPSEQGRKLIRIPRDGRKLESFELSDAEWTGLRLPIDLAYFVYRHASGRMVAYYPSPAGSTESLLSLDTWTEIQRRNPALSQMQPGVEALLVDRTRGNRRYFVAPIDQCSMLTGLIRTHWRGFSGGEAVWEKVDEFFRTLEERARA